MIDLLSSGLRAGLSLTLGTLSGLGPGDGNRLGALTEIVNRYRRTSKAGTGSWPRLELYLPDSFQAGLKAAELSLVGSAHELAHSARVFLPAGVSRWQLREIENKLRAYLLFRKGGELLAEEGLDRRIARAFVHTGYEALWLLEGIGYDRAQKALANLSPRSRELWKTRLPEAFLDRPLPIPALLPLHTGCGLSLARSLVAAAAHRSKRGLSLYLEACARLAWKGYEPILGEALGFAVRLLCPRDLAAVDGLLQDLRPSWRGLFWHGAGRGLYFSPGLLAPGLEKFKAALEASATEPIDEIGRRNALTGFAWAVSMVSFLTPEVLATFLGLLVRRSATRGNGELASAVDGITSVSLLWHDGLGVDAAYEAFCRPLHRPTEVWRKYVVQSCARALLEGAELRKAGPGSLFSYSGRGWADEGGGQ